MLLSDRQMSLVRYHALSVEKQRAVKAVSKVIANTYNLGRKQALVGTVRMWFGEREVFVQIMKRTNVADNLGEEWYTALFGILDVPSQERIKYMHEHLGPSFPISKLPRAFVKDTFGFEHMEARFRLTDADPRPLITPQWREENKDEWKRLWDNREEECPVCHEKPDMWDSPMNSDVPTRCTHWACVSCWAMIAEHDNRCPICRDKVEAWFVAQRVQTGQRL